MQSLIASRLLGDGGGGGSATLITKSVTQNGTYAATDDEADGYSEVSVNVQPSLASKTVTANGTYKASAFNKDGFSTFTVNVPDTIINTTTMKVTKNGSYSGGPSVYYAVPLPEQMEEKTDISVDISKGQFTTNYMQISYTHNTSGVTSTFKMNPAYVADWVEPQAVEARTMVVNDDVDHYIFIAKALGNNKDTICLNFAGYTINYIRFYTNAPLFESFEVDVEPNVIEKTITENGTYNAEDDEVDGYSKVIINVGSGGETKYYEYIRALNGQIIVRVEYPDAERTYAKQTLWFFNGFYTDGGDKPIPANLFPYLPVGWTTDVMMTSGYSDNTSETQIGWVGFLYPNRRDPVYTKFRTWTENKGSTLAGTFWGVLDISGEETQITEWFDPYENVPPRQIKNYGGTIEDGYNLNTNLKALGNVYHDSAMSYEIDNDSFDITWNQMGAYIGFSFNGDVDLKASDIQRISYKIDFGTCYDAANNQNIRPFIIGVTDTIRTTPSTGVYFDPSQVDNYFTKYKMYYKDVCNTTVEDYVDISDIEGPCYLFIVATGWIASITDLSMVSNSTPQIGTTLSQFNFFTYTNENSSVNRIDPVDTESFDVYWSGGIYIGHCLTGAVPLSGKKRLDIDMDYIGENYQHNSGTHVRNQRLAVVVTDTKVDSYVNLDNLERDNHIIAIKEWDGNDIYGQSIHTSIDLSNISGEYYINYQLPGFNINGFRARLYPTNAILPKYPNNVILSNKPIQDSQGHWITYNFDTPLTVGKSYLIMWSSGKSVDTHPFATAFTLVNSSENVSLTAHGVTATLSVSKTSLFGTYSNDYDTRLRKINLIEIPSDFSNGLEF